MPKEISKTQEIMSRLTDEKKVVSLDTPENAAAVESMNQQLEVVKRDYQIKEKESQHSAQQVILNS